MAGKHISKTRTATLVDCRIKPMRDEEIQKRIASFPRWHYRFDLRGHETPIFNSKVDIRHHQRASYFFDPMVDLFGGTLHGKRVLDLGCNAGWWSLRAVESGADYVLGIEGRRMHVDQANLVFEAKDVSRKRYDFVEANLFDLDLRSFGQFDVVLCLGLLYHISKPMELMEQVSAVNTDLIIIDTVVSKGKDSYFEVRHEGLEEPRHAVDYELVMIPSVRAVHDLGRQFGYSAVTLKPNFADYRGSSDFRLGARRAFFCAKQTDLGDVRVEVEPLPPADGSDARV